MVAISTILLALTIAVIVFGAIMGAIRGRNRSILRIIMILLCAVVAFLVRDLVVNSILSIEISTGVTLESELIHSLFGDTSSMEQMGELVILLVKSLFSLIAFIVVFYLLQLITWIILFPICKIFVKKDKNADGEYKNQAGFGALVGVIQGFLIAVIVFAPLSGAIVQMDKIMVLAEQMNQVENGGEPVDTLSAGEDFIVSGYAVTLEEDYDEDFKQGEPLGDEGLAMIREFANSGIAKFYDGVGGWLFDAVASTTDEEGTTITLTGAVDTIDVLTNVASGINTISSELEDIDLSSPTTALDSIGDLLINIGKKTQNLDENGRTVFNKVIDTFKEMLEEEMTGAEGEEQMKQALDMLNIETLDLVSVGNAMKSLAIIWEEPEVKYQDAANIVDGIYDNKLIFQLLSETTICNLEGQAEETFSEAINQMDIENQDRETLYNIFGLND